MRADKFRLILDKIEDLRFTIIKTPSIPEHQHLNSDRDIIRYIATIFSSLAVAYFTVGVIQEIIRQPSGAMEVLLNLKTEINHLTLAYSLVISGFMAVFGCAMLRYLDD